MEDLEGQEPNLLQRVTISSMSFWSRLVTGPTSEIWSVICSHALLTYATGVWLAYLKPYFASQGIIWANLLSKHLDNLIPKACLQIAIVFLSLLVSQFSDPGILNKEIEYLELDRQQNGSQVRPSTWLNARAVTFSIKTPWYTSIHSLW
jgi:hypothetical protein